MVKNNSKKVKHDKLLLCNVMDWYTADIRFLHPRRGTLIQRKLIAVKYYIKISSSNQQCKHIGSPDLPMALTKVYIRFIALTHWQVKILLSCIEVLKSVVEFYLRFCNADDVH